MRIVSLISMWIAAWVVVAGYAPTAQAELNLRLMIAFTEEAAEKVDANQLALKIVNGWQTYLDENVPTMAANLALAGNQAQVLALNDYQSVGGRVCSLVHTADLLAQSGDSVMEQGGKRSFNQLRDFLEADVTFLITGMAAKEPVDGKVDVDYGMAAEKVRNTYQLAYATLGYEDAQNTQSSIVAFMGLVTAAANSQLYYRDRSRALQSVIDGLDKASIDRDYDDLMKQAKSNPAPVDFARLRALYSQSSRHAPVRHIAPSYKTDLREAGRAINQEKDYPKALKHCSAILDRHYLDIEGHFWCMRALEGLKRRDEAVYHQHFLNGLIKTLYADGDGHCPEFPMSVVDMSEEFSVMYLNGFRRQGQSAIEVAGVPLDHYTAVSFRSGEPRHYYFDTTVLRQGYSKKRDVTEN